MIDYFTKRISSARHALRRRSVGALLFGLAVILAPPAFAVVVTDSSATLQWAPASGPAIGYRVQRSLNGGSFQDQPSTIATDITINGQPGDVVRLRVAAYNAAGQLGPWSAVSDPVEFQAAPPSGGTPGGGTGGTPPPTPGAGGTGHDFDGDGRDDLAFFDAASRRVQVWLMNGTSVVGGYQTAAAAAGYAPSGLGDFDGDGDTDILWYQSSSSRSEIWLIENGNTVSTHGLPTATPGWAPRSLGDMTGDGRSDVLWHNGNVGGNVVWEIVGGNFVRQINLPTTTISYHITATGDFDGDGLTDVVFHSDTYGGNAIWLLNQNGFRQQVNLPSSSYGWTPLVAADIDLNGRDDVVFRYGPTGQTLLWELDRGAFVAQHASSPNVATDSIPLVRDFAGDGSSDLIWVSPSSTEIWTIGGSTVSGIGNLPDSGGLAPVN